MQSLNLTHVTGHAILGRKVEVTSSQAHVSNAP